MRVEELAAYELIEKKEIKDLASTGYLLKHKKTGARIALLSNDDENKVFNIGFRTPPTDSTGVAHIIEHSTLCGSKDFPVKDPFVELVKGSLNTFLNAMTYSDKTVYPVASCNDKDFQNLMHVYLDAVFYPNFYKEEKIFRQEGWRYEMESLEDDLKINGVVYNEMKGAYSSPDDVNDREIQKSIFPNNTYGVVSGGDPKYIPDLTYENFLSFHGKYYHPSNSYIYLYGNMDMAEKLQWIDEKYLSKFDYLEIDSHIEEQKLFDKPVEVHTNFPILEDEALEDNTYLSYNAIVGNAKDVELSYAFDLIDYALCSSAGAPIKLALTKKNIGTEIYAEYDNGILQPTYSIVAKNANEEQKEEFVKTIEEELRKAVKDGLNKEALLAALNTAEFRYREADFGAYPKGLMYGLEMFNTWLYDDSMPFDSIVANDIFASLREKLNTDYYEKIVEKYLINNNHKTIVVCAPKKGLTKEEDQALACKLAALKNSLSKEEQQKIVDFTHALKKYQETPDDPKDLAKIPLLAREDLKKEAEPYTNELREFDGTKILFHNVNTNGIGYVRLVFDAKKVPYEYFRYIGVLKNVLGMVDTKNYEYGTLNNELNIHTGGVSTSIASYTDSKNLDEYKLTFEIKVKAFYRELNETFKLLTELMTASKFEDAKRLKEIVAEVKSRMQGNMTGSGHSTAVLRASSYFSKTAAISDVVSGIPALRLFEELESNFDANKDELIEKITTLAKMLFRSENLMVDFTGDEEGLKSLTKEIPTLKEKLFASKVSEGELKLELIKKNEAFSTSGSIQYVASAGNFIKNKKLPYVGTLNVLKVIMGYEYLWENVRVKGGAYGCMCGFGKNGDSYFVSYRDPNLKKTYDTYAGIGEYLRNYTADETKMTKYIIGTLSDMDTPLTPSQRGARSLAAFMSNVEYAEIQKERDELLNCTEADIRKLADYMDAILEEKAICVVGNGEAIDENKNLFMHVENLFH